MKKQNLIDCLVKANVISEIFTNDGPDYLPTATEYDVLRYALRILFRHSDDNSHQCDAHLIRQLMHEDGYYTTQALVSGTLNMWVARGVLTAMYYANGSVCYCFSDFIIG